MKKVLAAILTAIGAAAGAFAQSAVTQLPAATGQYGVGTTVRYWTDSRREEAWTADPDDRRRLAVQIWYPAADDMGPNAPYIFGLEKIGASIERYWDYIPKVDTNAQLDAKVPSGSRRFPLVVFSHGMNSSRFAYTALARELASHGYVVASIDHTFWGPGVSFPDGKPVQFEDGMIARDKLTSDEIDSMMRAGLEAMADDEAFVADRMREMDASDRLLKGRIDLSNVAVAGHSMGGMAAISACLRYAVFRRCISLDGTNYFLDKMPEPSEKPFLLLLNSQWGRNTPEKIAVRYLEAFKAPQVAILNGSKHNYFSDIPLIEPPEKLDGNLPPERAFRIIADRVLGFLAGRAAVEGKEPAELEVIDLKQFKK